MEGEKEGGDCVWVPDFEYMRALVEFEAWGGGSKFGRGFNLRVSKFGRLGVWRG